MILEIQNIATRVSAASQAELSWLHEFLSFADTKARFRTRYAGPSDICLLTKKLAFPSGLVPLVEKFAGTKGFAVDRLDRRVVPFAPNTFADLEWLRDYQRDAIRVGVDKVRGIFQHVTGAGKTEIICGLAKILPGNHVVMVDGTSLLGQNADRLAARTGETIGIVGDGKWSIERLTVASVDSLFADLDSGRNRFPFDTFHVLHVDEVHRLGGKSSYRCAQSFKSAYYRFGYSGSAMARGDGRNLLVAAAVGPIIHRITGTDLIERGVLAQPKIVMHRVVQPATHGDWREVYDAQVVHSHDRNSAIVRSVMGAKKPHLVFVKSLEHGKIISRALNTLGCAAEFVWGARNTPERKAAVKRLLNADTDVLVANVIFQEGIDIPELLGISNLAGGKSTIATVQQLGRGSRRHKDGVEVKQEFAMFDVWDAGCGAPCRHASCAWLRRHSRLRKQAYEREGYSVVIQ